MFSKLSRFVFSLDEPQPGPSGIRLKKSPNISPNKADDSDYDSDVECSDPLMNAAKSDSKKLNVKPSATGMEVLTAPDLQLDWVSDDDSDDEVVFVEYNQNVQFKFRTNF